MIARIRQRVSRRIVTSARTASQHIVASRAGPQQIAARHIASQVDGAEALPIQHLLASHDSNRRALFGMEQDYVALCV